MKARTVRHRAGFLFCTIHSEHGIIRSVVISTPKDGRVPHQLQIGLGEAIRRLVTLDARYRQGHITQTERAERELLFEGLNAIPVPLQASCREGEDFNLNGVPDTVEFFNLMAASNCCTLEHKSEVREAPAPKQKKTKAERL